MNAEAVAAAAALRYVNDNEPGISRHRAGRGFCYRLSDGALVREKAVRSRIAQLAIPPAWTDVWICPNRWPICAPGVRAARGSIPRKA